MPATASWTGSEPSSSFGTSVSTAGDVNGDGYSDVVIGAPDHSPHGRVVVYHGSSSGLSTGVSWFVDGFAPISEELGASVSTAGDVNGDGYADIIVGDPASDWPFFGAGMARIYYGSDGGLSTTFFRFDSSAPGYAVGTSVATAGDVNGDGLSDVIVGAPFYDGVGGAFVFHGVTEGLSHTSSWSWTNSYADGFFAQVLSTAGDVNGDGYADVVLGSAFYSNGETDEGRVLAFYGSASGLPATPSWVVEGDITEAALGLSAHMAGDVNGDGYSDVIAWAGLGPPYLGAAWVYYGSSTGLSALPDWIEQGDRPSMSYGLSYPLGDVNGDGYSDVVIQGRNPYELRIRHGSPTGLVTTPPWTGVHGIRAFGAGDVNGDGFSDMIVGDSTGDDSATVYHGSPTGLVPTPAWQVTGEGSQYVSTAGDVNGDGYSDVMVVTFDPVPTVQLYHGSSTGLSLTPSWSETEPGGGIPRAATAGDVNGDGYSDVFVGNGNYENGEIQEGRVRAFHGSASGLSTVPAWTVESNQAHAFLGLPVASAGDVNGDGYAEVIVRYDDLANFLEVAVFFGGDGGGLPALPRQLRSTGSAPIEHLCSSDLTDGFRLGLHGRSPFGRTGVKMEWEVKPFGTPFDGTGLDCGAVSVDSGTSGVALEEAVTGLLPGTSYHWRARVRYDLVSNPLQPVGPWYSPARDGREEADLKTAGIGAGSVSSGGAPVTISKAAGGDITLSWGDSCVVDDTAYEIYEGALGDFASHAPAECSMGGDTTRTITPATTDSYYLVVPCNSSREGSYGVDSNLLERPQGPSACMVQQLAVCD